HHGPVLVRHPDPRSSTALGTPTQLSVRAVGWGDLEYRWFKDGAPIAGATGSELTLGPATPHTPGQFMVEVEDAAGHVTRQSFLVSVVAPAALSWSRGPDGRTVLAVRHGTPGQSFQLERSSDLVNWVASEVGTFNPTGDFQFGPLPPDSPPTASFFRVLLR
ncbi:MAG: hypothetical protein IT580_15320, partial [Verrucomicrobiales bacterium]|nr:hypothetical protein [Verrucomicrobiales bacterium]